MSQFELNLQEGFNKTVRRFYTFCGGVSLFFLLITLVMYLTLPKLKNLQGQIVVANVTTVLVTTSIVLILYNATTQTKEESLQEVLYEVIQVNCFFVRKKK